jgi:LEA14-like dessication related protein
MKTWLKISLGVVGAGVLASGAYLVSQIQKLKTGAFKVLGAKGLVISGGKVSFELITQFKNNSNLSATVTNQDYDVLINGNRVGIISSKESIDIKAQDYNIIPLKVDVSISSILTQSLANVANFLNNKDAIKITLKGNLTWKKGFISAKQPFEFSYSLKEIEDLVQAKKS